SPTSYRVGELSVEYGMWDTGAINFDVGGPITSDGKLQYRVISSYTNFERYYDNSSDRRWSIMPMLAYEFNENSEVWIKFEKHDHEYSAYEGVPLDGRTGRMIDVSRKWNAHEDDPLNWRAADYTRLWGQFT